jgi:hypothetical protein
MSGPRPRDPAALGARLAAALRRTLGALARSAAFAALLALPMTVVLHASYALAFLFVLGAAAALDAGRAVLRRAQRAFPAACGKPEAWNERS